MGRFLLLWLAGCAVLGCSADFDELPIVGRIKQYDYTFDIETGHATAGLAIAVAGPGDCFVASFDLPEARAATWNWSPASRLTVANGTIEICGEPIAAGEPLAITVDLDVPKTVDGGPADIGFSRTQDGSGGEFTYLLSWFGGCSRFGPCEPDPALLAGYHFTVRHPANDVVLCPGELRPGTTTTECLLTGTLAPTYSAFSIAADPRWQRTDFLTAGGVDVVLYEVPPATIAPGLDRTFVAAFLTWITDLLGPYPYGAEIRYAGAPTVWAGFEHPASILLHQAAGDMHTFLHETVHQWAGDRTTIASVADFVWKEAIAEYLSYVFEDEHGSPSEAAFWLGDWQSFAVSASMFPRPTDDPLPALGSWYADVYGSGTMTLFVQLESLFGRPTVLDAIQRFLASPGARSVGELREALELASGRDLRPYFDAWVFGAGRPEWPTFAVATSQVGDQVTVTVTQQNASHRLYGCRVEVEVRGAASSAIAVVDFGVAPTAPSASATVALAEPVVSTVFDPRGRVVGRVAGAPSRPRPDVAFHPR
jgi:aminopeptidase N